jgi:hypothetical protein
VIDRGLEVVALRAVRRGDFFLAAAGLDAGFFVAVDFLGAAGRPVAVLAAPGESDLDAVFRVERFLALGPEPAFFRGALVESSSVLMLVLHAWYRTASDTLSVASLHASNWAAA